QLLGAGGGGADIGGGIGRGIHRAGSLARGLPGGARQYRRGAAQSRGGVAQGGDGDLDRGATVALLVERGALALDAKLLGDVFVRADPIRPARDRPVDDRDFAAVRRAHHAGGGLAGGHRRKQVFAISFRVVLEGVAGGPN